MPTTHFLDLHVLGDAPAVRASLAAARKKAQAFTSQSDGDVVGDPSKPRPSQAPWPPGQSHGVMGVAFDHGYADPEGNISALLKAAQAASPAPRVALAVHYSFGMESVKVWAMDRQGRLAPPVMIGSDALFQKHLGTSLEEALDDDDLLDDIGDRMLPAFMDAPALQALLAPLYAQHQASRMDQRLPPPENKARPARM